jgi:prepilin-type N-terminal cleavage/methylation domain-containing protein
MIAPSCPTPASRRGFLLLEVVLALAVFGIAATGFAVAIHRMGGTAELAQRELKITRILESALDEAVSIPTMEVGSTSTSVADTNIEIDTEIELIDDLVSEEGQNLQDMYRVKVTAHWYQDGVQNERVAETWRFGRMYQP